MTAATLEQPVTTARPQRDYRPEVQGLRALAVGLVVLYHLWPDRLTGGYVGVDVFFVISGYLITSHLQRELQATGSIQLKRFWARRIRRLLPASLLVLAVSVVGVVTLLPATVWMQSARQIGAAALYVQNWALAGDAVDYMAADNVPTVAQHYWSLSVEEQFYLVWPVLILALARWSSRSRGRGAAPGGGMLVPGLVVLALTSRAWSVMATATDRSAAYFVTPTRVWEFAAGALLALLGALRLGSSGRAALAWAGLVAIVVAGVTFDDATLFPGWVALLPVLGTVAVIAAGTTPSRWSPGPLLSVRPVTFVGDISYSVYLWHWPLIVLWPAATGVDLRTQDKLAILALTGLLAWASKRWVEDPARLTPRLAAAPWRSFAFAAAGMAVVLSLSWAITAEVQRRADSAAVVAAAESLCLGPSALDPANDCGAPEGDGALVPPPEVVALQNAEPAYPGCQQGITLAEVVSCQLGSTSDDPARVVAVVGDSHATQWFPALDDLGRERDWRVLTYAKSSCPFTTATRTLPGEQTDEAQLSCAEWVRSVRAELLENCELSLVLTASYSTAYGWEPGREQLADPRTDGFERLWQDLTDGGLEVYALSDVPRTLGGNVPNCLAANPEDRMACAVPRDQALPGSALVDAARQVDDDRVHLVDLDSRYCDDTWCYPVVGDLVVYRDYSHLSAEYARALVPSIAAQVPR